MKSIPDSVAEAGLRVFGTIAASVTHELKNNLAIINESAGLLEDLTLMAENGKALDPMRLKTLAQSIQKQVSRADEVIRSLNRYAHSVDTPLRTEDIHDLLDCLMVLARRMTRTRGVSFSLCPSSIPVTVTTAPVFINNLLWRALCLAMDTAGDGKVVEIEASHFKDTVKVRFSGLEALTPEKLAVFQGEPETALLKALDAQFSVNEKMEEISFTLPAN